MVLKFTNVGENWVAEFSVTDDFNLHIEREESGYLIVNQRTTAEGKYDSIRDGSFNYGDPVVDIDFTGVIYPKYIQIISKVEPTYAEVTSNGEVEQIGGGGFEFTVSYPGMGVEPTTYSCDEGMTWREWCDSEYNTLGYIVDDSEIIGVVPEFGYTGSVMYKTPDERYYSLPDDLIESREYYLSMAA